MSENNKKEGLEIAVYMQYMICMYEGYYIEAMVII